MILPNTPSLAGIFKNPWPVIKTENIYDYTQANGNPSPYVWLVDQYTRIDPNFLLGWTPENQEKDSCHIFMKKNSFTGRDIQPAAALVPNTPTRRRSEIYHDRPAALDKNLYDIYVKIDRTAESRERFKTFARRWNNVHSIFVNEEAAICKSVLRTISKNHAWIVELDHDLGDDWDFDLVPVDADKIYIMPNGVRLYPIQYFLSLGKDDITEVKVDRQ